MNIYILTIHLQIYALILCIYCAKLNSIGTLKITQLLAPTELRKDLSLTPLGNGLPAMSTHLLFGESAHVPKEVRPVLRHVLIVGFIQSSLELVFLKNS